MARPTCPVCRAPMIRVVFGLPPPALVEAEERGELHLAGCCLPAFPPNRWCPNCRRLRDFTCPVCGYRRLPAAPWDDEERPCPRPCPSCGTRFGIDTAEPWDDATHRELRRRWVEAGCPWRSEEKVPPRRWDPHDQLRVVEGWGRHDPGPVEGWD